jgi:Kdo2-lipid IVA lauroyltransferase/acyltransferase
MKSFRFILQKMRYGVSLSVLLLIRFLPHGLVLNLLRSLAAIAWLADPFHRKVAGIQMRCALGLDTVWPHVLKVFMNQADILVDTIKYSYLSEEELRKRVKIEGKGHLDEALKTGRGIMMITGHIGNWEILAHIPRLLGTSFCVMADMRKDPLLESLVDKIRSRSGATILPPEGMARMLVRELKKGSVIGMVVDSRGDLKGGLFCDVFGMPAPTNRAPAFIALKGNAIVLPVCAVKTGGVYHIRFFEGVDAAPYASHDDAIRDLSAFMQSWITRVVKEHPLQWFWLYSRWINRSRFKKNITGVEDFRRYVFSQAGASPVSPEKRACEVMGRTQNNTGIPR